MRIIISYEYIILFYFRKCFGAHLWQGHLPPFVANLRLYYGRIKLKMQGNDRMSPYLQIH